MLNALLSYLAVVVRVRISAGAEASVIVRPVLSALLSARFQTTRLGFLFSGAFTRSSLFSGALDITATKTKLVNKMKYGR